MPLAYIETTIPSYLASRRARDVVQIARQEKTRLWWETGASGFELCTSQETLDEAGRGDEERAAERLSYLANLSILEVTIEVENLTLQLLEVGLVPKNVASDALHIATATVHRADFLVTWNFKHIANPHIRARLRDEVASTGWNLPVLCTPEELLRDEDH